MEKVKKYRYSYINLKREWFDKITKFEGFKLPPYANKRSKLPAFDEFMQVISDKPEDTTSKENVNSTDKISTKDQNRDDDMNDKIESKIEKLQSENFEIKLKLQHIDSSTNTIKQVVMVSIPIIIFIVGIMITLSTSLINSKFDSLNQKLDSTRENNSMQIQRDVAKEFLKQKG